MLNILIYIFITLLFCVNIYFIIKFVEYVYCAFIIKQPPNVSTVKITKQKIVEQINTYYKMAKTVCDIGSGYGNLARFIAKNTNKKVVGIENVKFSVYVSKILNVFCGGNLKIIQHDAYDYFDKTEQIFDICIAYLGPQEVQKLIKYKHKMRVLICVDFKINSVKPTRIINAGHGYTLFNHKKYPHKLFIYEF